MNFTYLKWHNDLRNDWHNILRNSYRKASLSEIALRRFEGVKVKPAEKTPSELLAEFTTAMQQELYGHPKRKELEGMLQSFIEHEETVEFLGSG